MSDSHSLFKPFICPAGHGAWIKSISPPACEGTKTDGATMPDTTPDLPPQPATTSLIARLMNVFAMPGEVFEEVKTAPPTTGNWLVPVLMNAIVGAIAAIILMSQPAILQGIREKQEAQFQKMVEQGKMSQADADKAMVVAEKFTGPTLMKITGVVDSVVASFAALFWWTTVLWLLGRYFLRTEFGYIKAMETAGLASMIGVLGAIVTLLLQINFSNLTTSPSLGLLVDNFDAKKVSHLVLAAVNVFGIWRVFVESIALARLANVPLLRSASVMIPVWLLCQSVMITMAALASRLGG